MSSPLCRTGASLLAWVLTARPLVAQPTARPSPPPRRQAVSVRPAPSPVRVDGALDEAAWAQAALIPLSYEWAPGDNVPPREKTECLVTFDAQHLYVAFRAHDREPAAIRAHLADRDTAFQDDTVGFLIDPFNDERRAFQFRANPLGVQMDAINSDVDGSEDWAWDAIWESRGALTADGYVVEIAVPFSSLRFPATTDVQTWGFSAMRDLPRSLRYRMRSSYTDRNKTCLVCQLDKVDGLQGLRPPGRNAELDPTLTSTRTDLAHDRGPLQRGDVDTQPGLTARWGVTPSLTLSGAVNPDFSQVEADVAQLDVNTRFALFYPEKRPLFLEGADFFSTPIGAVFTRTVADPRWGLKLTGKEGRSAIGVFLVRDTLTNLLFPANQGSSVDSIDDDVWSGVVRYRFDLRRNSTLGVLYTGREGGDYHNRVGGLDGSLRFSGADSLRFQYLRSSTRYPRAVAERNDQPRGAFDGYGYALGYNHGARNWQWFGNLGALSPEFRADSGFEPRVDTRTASAGGGRVVWGRPGQWFTRLELFASVDRTTDHQGRLTDRGFDFPITYFGPRQTVVSYNPAPNLEFFAGTTYQNFRHNFSFEIRPSGRLFFALSGTVGRTIDFANARQADLFRLSPQLDFNLARGLAGTLRHNLQRLEVPGGRLFLANLTELRMIYHFDVRTFVRAILQYTDVDRDPSLYLSPVLPRSRRLFSQFLFSYKLNPQTVLLLGYSDNQLADRELDLVRTDRTLFVKVGYALVF